MMDKNMKMAALEAMAGKSEDMKAHMAECPKCGFRWMMGSGKPEMEDEEEGYEEMED